LGVEAGRIGLSALLDTGTLAVEASLCDRAASSLLEMKYFAM
jgi:hypothetical protein